MALPTQILGIPSIFYALGVATALTIFAAEIEKRIRHRKKAETLRKWEDARLEWSLLEPGTKLIREQDEKIYLLEIRQTPQKVFREIEIFHERKEIVTDLFQL